MFGPTIRRGWGRALRDHVYVVTRAKWEGRRYSPILGLSVVFEHPNLGQELAGGLEYKARGHELPITYC